MFDNTYKRYAVGMMLVGCVCMFFGWNSLQDERRVAREVTPTEPLLPSPTETSPPPPSNTRVVLPTATVLSTSMPTATPFQPTDTPQATLTLTTASNTVQPTLTLPIIDKYVNLRQTKLDKDFWEGTWGCESGIGNRQEFSIVFDKDTTRIATTGVLGTASFVPYIFKIRNEPGTVYFSTEEWDGIQKSFWKILRQHGIVRIFNYSLNEQSGFFEAFPDFECEKTSMTQIAITPVPTQQSIIMRDQVVNILPSYEGGRYDQILGGYSCPYQLPDSSGVMLVDVIPTSGRVQIAVRGAWDAQMLTHANVLTETIAKADYAYEYAGNVKVRQVNIEKTAEEMYVLYYNSGFRNWSQDKPETWPVKVEVPCTRTWTYTSR